MQPSGTILAYLVEGRPRNISVNIFENWSIGLGEDIIQRFFSIFSSGRHLVYRSRTILSILEGSQLGIIPVKSVSNWLKGLRGNSI